MTTRCLTRIFVIASFSVFASSIAFGHEPKSDSDGPAGHADEGVVMTAPASGHHALVHPFVAHMGMPDEPGEISVRLMSITERNAGMANGTYGFHLEAGVAERLGLHLRNDSIATHNNTELMLQYALLKSGENGIALIGEIEFPTGPTTDNQNKYLSGLSFAYYWNSILSVNSVVHYNAPEKMTEWEIAFVSRMTAKIFPVLEFRGEAMKAMSTTKALLALKFKLPQGNAIGLGYQIPISTIRDFDSQLISEVELNF